MKVIFLIMILFTDQNSSLESRMETITLGLLHFISRIKVVGIIPSTISYGGSL